MRRVLPLCALAVAAGTLAGTASPAAAQSSYLNGMDDGLAMGLMQQELQQDRQRNREYQDRREHEDQEPFNMPTGGLGKAEEQVTNQWYKKCYGPAFHPHDLSPTAIKRRNDCWSSEEAKYAGELKAAIEAGEHADECRTDRIYGHKPKNCP